VVATAITTGFHIPEGHWATITIFTVSQADAGASLAKGIQRAVGTLVGGIAGIVTVILFADQPWIRIPVLGFFAASGLFLSRTTTAPYVGLLASFTALLIGAQVRGSDPSAAVAVGLWRIVLIVLGVAIGTGAQLYLWPDDPEEHLLGELAERLRTVTETIRRCITSAVAPGAVSIEASLVHHLDLLTNAETRYPSLRLRHLEQITLIGGVEHLLTAAAGLERAAHVGRVPGEQTRTRLTRIAARCDRLRDAIMARHPFEDDAREARGDDALAGGDDVRMLPAIIEMERVLERMGEATGFLGGAHPTPGSPTAMARSPLDSQAPAKFLTPACSLSNTVDLAFALKGGLAASSCDLLVNGFAWPGVQTSIWTTVLVAQATQGAIVQKALLRLVGAAVGGLLGVLAIVSVMPNLENLISFLVVVAIGSGCAAWLSTGSARIAYAGLQIGLAFALTLGDAPGPTTSMIAARDRVLGVLLGNVVAAVVYLGFGSGRARDAMAKSMAATLRSLSTLVRVGSGGAERPELAPTRGHRWTVYQNLLTTLRLHDEAGYEPGATLPETLAARDAVLRLVGDAQGLFLAILSLVRHRLDIDLHDVPEALRNNLRSFGVAVAESIDSAAARVEGRSLAVTDYRPLLASAERAFAQPSLATLDARLRTHLEARLELYRDLLPLLDQLAVDSTARPFAPALLSPRR
jgi:multidrug resistance protein MdtO